MIIQKRIKMKIDENDKKILKILQDNSNITNTKLASEVGISSPAMLERVKRLERSGLIKEYVALVDHHKAGKGVMAMVLVSLAIHEMDSLDTFEKTINEIDEVLECYHIAGDEDFIMKVVVKDINEYRDFVVNKITNIAGINRIKTTFVLSTIKYKTNIDIE